MITPLKRLLFERGLTNRWLAQQCNVDETGMSLIVNGKRTPSLPLALKIARVMGVSVEELFSYVIDEEGRS
jgi:DNA-binding XRE family transcriptional regulator